MKGKTLKRDNNNNGENRVCILKKSSSKERLHHADISIFTLKLVYIYIENPKLKKM